MLTIFVIIHILISLVLILSILLQSGKGGSLAGALGGGGGAAGAVLGTRGAATMLSKVTTYASVLFLVSCLGLSFMFKGGRGGERVQTAAEKEAARRRTGLTPMQTQAPAQSAPASSVPAPSVPAQPAEKK